MTVPCMIQGAKHCGPARHNAEASQPKQASQLKPCLCLLWHRQFGRTRGTSSEDACSRRCERTPLCCQARLTPLIPRNIRSHALMSHGWFCEAPVCRFLSPVFFPRMCTRLHAGRLTVLELCRPARAGLVCRERAAEQCLVCIVFALAGSFSCSLPSRCLYRSIARAATMFLRR
jgi:hypothetical protein